MLIWQILGVTALVAANGFFVAAEFALVKVRASDFEPAARPRSAPGLVQHMLGHLDAYLSACQLGITLASLGLGWAGEPLVARMLEPAFHAMGLPEEQVHYVAFPVAFVLITFLHLTVGEQAPKIAAIQRPRPASLLVAWPLRVFYVVFRPFIWFINASSNGLLRIVGFEPVSSHDQEITEEEVRMLLTRSAAMGHLTPREQIMMTNVLDLEEKSARSCMVPRSQIVYLNREDPVDEMLEVAARSGHTRFPLCDGGLENIRGIVHIKDIFSARTLNDLPPDLDTIVREVRFLPENLRLDALLREFQRSHNHMAILVDEYGGVAGMITLENVIEEMVGPIEDEFDTEERLIVRTGEEVFQVDARCPVSLMARSCGVKLPADVRADTVGGLLTDLMGHIPQKGETAELGDHRLTVEEAGPRRVLRVRVEPST